MRAHGPVMELPEASSADHPCWEHADDEFIASGSGMPARGVPLEVRGASALLQRMWRILGLDDVAAIAFSAPRG